MDEKDEKILELLKKDARCSFTDIGKEVGLTEAAIRRRVANLVKTGVIKRFTIELGQGASAITLAAVNPSIPTSFVSEKLKELEGVESVYEITGQYDIAVILSAANIAELNRCVDDIRRVDGVGNTNTVIVLRSIR